MRSRDIQKSERICFSRSLLMRQRREIGLLLEGGSEGVDDFGIGTIKEDFQSRGTRPVGMGSNMWQSGEAIDAEDEMPSGPEAVLDGRWEIRQRMPFSVQRSLSGQGKGGEEVGMGERGGAEQRS